MGETSSEISVETGASTIDVLSTDQNTIMEVQDASSIRSDDNDDGDNIGILPSSALADLQISNLPDDDPLEVKSLALEFDYLIYKIQDRVKTLSDQTKDSVTAQKVNYENDIARINANIGQINDLVRECDLIENEFVKIEQISQIAKDFTMRLTQVEKKLQQRRKLEKESRVRY
ncbi:unnamed protein product [Kuraishia capsulata CBS 1993]|uniref:Biogenesis of lysosome-related organelles complex 1 subunit CNL1 n=1 Tax=Kuraishia capsulata CBS 1993 TaxID=1382522 RepID=W6MGH9_9ASCO|nr:uncharacterized protein KUCA_T00000584001 [Kuraishia capsulata CBS 1993]CDK24618.1 unnamed protein product [Kuraishia capsulata CBS 1993]